MTSDIWRTTFDVVGLATYLTIMTGELPERRLLSAARARGYGRKSPARTAAPESEPQPAHKSGDLAQSVAATDV